MDCGIALIPTASLLNANRLDFECCAGRANVLDSLHQKLFIAKGRHHTHGMSVVFNMFVVFGVDMSGVAYAFNVIRVVPCNMWDQVNHHWPTTFS